MARVGPIEVTVDAANRVATFTSLANPTLEEWMAALELVVTDPAYRPGFAIVSDRRAVAEAASASFVREAARYLALRPALFAGCRWAVVTDTAVGYGNARMAQAALPDGVEVRAFADAESAMAWARTGEEPPAPGGARTPPSGGSR